MLNNIELKLVYVNTFLFSCIQMLLYVTIPYIENKTGIPVHHLAGSISIGSLIFAFSGPIISSLSDRLGRKKVISVSMLGLGISFLILSLIFIFNNQLSLPTKIALIYISRIIYGLLASGIVPVSQAALLDHFTDRPRIKTLSKNSMSLNLGRIIAPILILIKGVNFIELIYIATIFIFASSFYQLKKSEKTKLELKSVNFDFKSFSGLIKISKFPILLALVYTGFIGILHSTLGHHLKKIFLIKGEEATILMAQIVLAISLIGFISQGLIQKFKNDNWKTIMNLGAGTLILGAFILNYTSTISMMWVSIFIIGIGLALIPPVYLSLISKKIKDENYFGRQIGVASVAHSLGYAFGAGLIALSLKMNLVSITFTIVFISIVIGSIVTKINFDQEIQQ